MHRYRMNRRTYWVSLAIVLVGLGILVSAGWTHGGLELAMVAIGIPRLHDIGRSGWIVGGVIAGEFVAIFGALLSGGGSVAIAITGGLIVLIVAGLAIWLGLIPGESGPNKWGDQPPSGVHLWGARSRG